MPYVDPANYPDGIPEGAFHLDQDDEHNFHFPRTMDHDFLLYHVQRVLDQSLYWAVCENVRSGPRELSAAELAAGPTIMRDRRIRDLTAQAAALQAQLAAAPPPPVVNVQAPAAQPRSHIRVHAPRTFSGVANDKGVYDPTPRDFVRNVRNYLTAEEQAANNALTDENKIILVSTLLDQSAAMWYEQVLDGYRTYQRAHAANPTLAYTGPLTGLDVFLQAFLEQFEDVDIQKTAIFKVQSMQQGAQSAEVHTRLFRDWAGHTGFNDPALIELYKKSLKPAIRDKVNGQGKHRPTTLKGWYEDAVLFDRQWREDHPGFDRAAGNTNTRTQSGGTQNNSGQPTRGQQPQQSPRKANQQQQRNSNWRPWGTAQQPARAPAPAANTGVIPMDIDAANAAFACYRCGEKHLARDCTTPVEVIRQKYGRDRMIPFPPRYQARATQFANAAEFAASLSPADRAELAWSLQSGVKAPNAPPAPAPQQGFASGST